MTPSAMNATQPDAVRPEAKRERAGEDKRAPNERLLIWGALLAAASASAAHAK